mmetsp:Transcript_4493/g.9439  ORF Transcript_4493/g.9439 Transcript_4493/m.9439 type:complete len:170 (-) Transcript_4493:397-906(-)
MGYSKEFKCGDSFLVREDSWGATLKLFKNSVILYAVILFPKLFGAIVPQPGDGPDRKAMEGGSLTLHGIGKMVNTTAASSGTSERDEIVEKTVKAKFRFNKDVSYLYTAVLLVETGLLLVEKSLSTGGKINGGILTPSTALGSDLTQRILREMDTSFHIEEINDEIETP